MYVQQLSRPSGLQQRPHQQAQARTTRRSVRSPALFDALRNLGRPKAPDLPDELLPEFTQWLASQGVPQQQVVLRECGAEGRGLVARNALPRGTQLLQLPGSLLITQETALQASSLAPLLRTISLPEWSLIALLLAELRPRTRGASSDKGTGSGQGSAAQAAAVKWGPYLRVLPAQTGTVLEWSDKEVAKLLGGPLQRRARAIRGAAQATWQELAPLIEQGEKDGLIAKGTITQQDVTWALGIMLSRLVRLQGLGDAQALVPWADFANHSPAASAFLDWDPRAGPEGAGAVVLLTERAYEQGEQVYISYGQKSAGELLLSYGFAPPPATHPHETYPLEVPATRAGDQLAAAKVAALARRGLPPTAEFPLRVEGMPGGLAAWAAFRAASLTDEAAVEALAARLFGLPLPGSPNSSAEPSGASTASAAAAVWPAEPLPAPVLSALASQQLPPDLESQALREVAALCSAALKAYPTTMDQDRATTQDSTKAGGGGNSAGAWREGVCAAIRVKERQILARTETVASGRARELRRQR